MVNGDEMRTCLNKKNIDKPYIEDIVYCATSAPNVTIFVTCLKLKGVPTRLHTKAVECYNENNR
jgi:hypothetical protein